IVPTSRVHLPYTVDGEDHDFHIYCETVAGGPPFSLVGWGIAGNPTFQDAAASMNLAMYHMWHTGDTTFADILLEQFDGSAWNPIEGYTPAVQPDSSSSLKLATQVTVVLRDDQFRKVRPVLMETIYINPLHVTSQSVLPTALQAFVAACLSTAN